MHFSAPSFWLEYDKLLSRIQKLADQVIDLLKQKSPTSIAVIQAGRKILVCTRNLEHPGARSENNRRLGMVLIGPHSTYDRLIK